MKTRKSELKEVKAQGIVMIAFYVLVMAGVLIITGGNSQETALRLKGSETLNHDEETLKLFASTSNAAAFESESFLNNLYEALEPVEEQAIMVSDMLDIHFPAILNEEANHDYTESTYIKSMLEERNRAIAAECELIWNMKECLKVESENPLKIENWMFDDDFWIPGSK